MDAGPDDREMQLNALWDTIFHAEGLPEPEAAALLRDAIDAVSSLAKDDADFAYALGYAWYVFPRRVAVSNVASISAAQQWLSHAISLQPEHAKAWLYMGYLEYDCGRYREAEACFEHVDVEDFESEMLSISLAEMKVCCRVRLSGWSAAAPLLEQFVRAVEGSDVGDVFPKSLAKVIQDVPLSEAQDRGEIGALLARADDAARFIRPWLSKR